MTDHEELEDLESGLSSAFWRRFLAHVNGEWGPRGEMYLQSVAGAMANLDDDAQRRGLECVQFAQKVVRELLIWPEHRVSVLKREADDAPMTYAEKMQRLRGQDQQMAQTGRRGRL